MLQQATIGDQILEVVRANPDCTFKKVVQQFPDLDWSDLYIEVELLRLSGRLRMIHNYWGLFTSTVRLP